MAMEQFNIQQQIIARAMKDDAFRQQFLSHPKETIEQELGITLPPEARIQVHEDTATTLHLVLPVKAQMGEWVDLSDAELEQASGVGPPKSDYTCDAACDKHVL